MFKIREYQNVYVDSFVTNVNQNLLFISLYGGESQVRRILGAIEINELSKLTIDSHDLITPVNIPNKKALHTKRSKVDNQTFDHLLHCYIYHNSIIFNDSSIVANVLVRHDGDANALLWERVKSMTVTPLLDDWKDSIIECLFLEGRIIENNVVSSLNTGITESYHMKLGVEDLNEMVVDMLKNNSLGIPA